MKGLKSLLLVVATLPLTGEQIRPHVEQWSPQEYEQVSERGPTAVMFSADWCGPCHALHPTFERLSTRYPNVRFGEIDVDTYPQGMEGTYPQPRRRGGVGIPTVWLEVNGREDERTGTLDSAQEDYQDLTRRIEILLGNK